MRSPSKSCLPALSRNSSGHPLMLEAALQEHTAHSLRHSETNHPFHCSSFTSHLQPPPPPLPSFVPAPPPSPSNA